MELIGYFVAVVLLGGLFLVGIRLLARPLSHVRTSAAAPKPSAALSSLEQVDAAYIVARREGGRIEDLNDRARRLFGLNGDTPNLHRMARMAKPEDSFYDLLAAEGRAHITVANHLVEATSILFPHDTPQYVVMLLRENTPLTGLRVDDRSSQAIAALAEVGRALSASLDLETTLHAVLQTVGRIVQYDLAEVNLWESDTQVLRPRVRNGDRPSLITIDQRVHFYRLDEGYSGWLASHKRPLLIGNIEQYADVKPKLSSDEFPFKSMIGVPLLYGKDGELVGTLELASFYPDAYTEQDLVLLETVAGQAAIAIRNAQRYSQQESRIAELSGLAQVAQTASTLADARELYASLVDRIAKLMSVQFCGFLLHDERERSLIAQPPFRGVPEAFRERYRIFAPPDSQAARMWRETESWYTDDMRVDPRVEEFGIKPLAEALGMSASLIVPLIVGGNRLGIVQVANKLNQSPFNEEDARLLRTLAGQAAVLIDNARLVREAEDRVHRSEVLRQISEITGSALSLDEIYQEVMGRLAKLLNADIGAVLLLDEAKGELTPQPGSLYHLNPADAERVYLRTDSPDFKLSTTMTRRPFFSSRASRDRRIASQFRRAIDYFKLESIIAVPLVVQDRNIGEMWWGAVPDHRFARTDVPLVATVAAQLASAIERARLASITDETLRRRVEQLTSLTRVGRELNQTIELEHILRLVYDETVRTTLADCGSILLLDLDTPGLPTARMRIGAHTGNLTLNVVEYDAALSGNTHIIPDITAPNALESLNLGALPAGLAAPGHQPIRSLLVAPIAYQGVTVGIIDLHSHTARAFDKVMLDFSQAIAAQAAVAVGNAQRYEEQIHRGELLRRRADQLSQLLQISRSVRSDRPLETNLEAIAFGVQEAVGFNIVIISVLDSNTKLLRRLACAGAPIAEVERLKQNPGQLESIQPALQPQFRISHSYYVPHHRTPEALRAIDTVPVARTTPAKPGEWAEGDYLFVPLIGSGGHIVGMMTVDDPRNNQVPDLSTIETLEIFANQSALAIENARLYQSAESRAAELSQSLGQLQKSYHELDVVSRTLTRKEQELSTLIEQTELRARRLLGLHRVASATAEVRVEDGLLQRAARSTVVEMDVDVCIIALLREGTLLQITAQATATDLAIDQQLPGNMLGTLEVIYGKDFNSVFMRNANLRAPVRTLPDGRPYYGGAGNNELNNLGGGAIFVIDNKRQGHSLNVSAQVRKEFGAALNTTLSYSFTSAKNNLKSTEIASVLWQNQPVQGDPNNPEVSWSEFGLRHRIVGTATWARSWSDRLKTSIGVFLEIGHGNRFGGAGGNRYSFIYAGDVNGDGQGGNDLIYIPANASDIILLATPSATVAQQSAALEAFIEQDNYLSTHRGQIAERFGAINPWYSNIDLRILQDFVIGGGTRRHNLQLSVDMLNFANLFNSSWGVRKVASPAATSPLTLVDFDASGAPRFNFTGPAETFIDDPSLLSRWRMQVGLRYFIQ